MLVSVLSNNLQDVVSLLNHAVATRSQLPILSNFLLEAENGRLTLSATDLEIGLSMSTASNIQKTGRTTVPAKNFSDLISNLPSQKITLETEGNELKLKGDKFRASFQTMPPEEFPKLYDKKGTLLLKVSKKEIGEYFSRVVFASALDTTRPALSGILVEPGKSGSVLVATDQYRLSYQKTPLKTSGAPEEPLVIPARVIKELFSLKGDGAIEFYVSKENNQVLISQEEITLVGRLIDAEYPSYGKIIPDKFATKTEFSREELLGAIRICSIFARETANVIKLTIENDRIVVSANSPQVGADLVEVSAKTTGEENEIAFNAKYLIDVLSTLSSERIVFEMNGPLNSGVFRIVGDSSFLHLIMPIRVQG